MKLQALKKLATIATAIAGLLVPLVSQAAPTAAQLCLSSKQMAASKQAQCLLRARSGLQKLADGGKYDAALTKCDASFQKGFDVADLKWGGACTQPGWALTVNSELGACISAVDSLVTGGALPSPPPPTAAQSCASAKLGAASSYGQCVLKADSVFSKTGDAAKRSASLAKCEVSLQKGFDGADAKYGGACALPGGTSAVKAALDACTANVTTYLMSGSNPTPTPTPTPSATPTPTPCTPTTSGNYTDNCDGTVTDGTTGLIWEKKTSKQCWPELGATFPDPDCIPTTPDVHEVTSKYKWTWDVGYPAAFNGGVKVDFLDVLNSPPCFAGSCNWRLPTLTELSGLPAPPELGGVLVSGGIVDPGSPGCGTLPNSPCIDPIFGPTYTGPAQFYWTSTEGGPCFAPTQQTGCSAVWAESAYGIDFGTRAFWGNVKSAENPARAVRDP